eukprot:TRINITY_DN2795_c0_g1_i4.p1 TRINITY_DN2795_c0_g1~~TRINITY_DN2795_c0_g1_i4.p1  ORF type:complete len:525 (-),score=64.08 TRINITY_DN2795_c0_g1_i4:298-1872(-)
MLSLENHEAEQLPTVHTAWVAVGNRQWAPVDYTISHEIIGSGSEGQVKIAKLHMPRDLHKHQLRFAVKNRVDLYKVPSDLINIMLEGERFASASRHDSIFINGAMAIQHSLQGIQMLYPHLMRTSLSSLKHEIARQSPELQQVVLGEMIPSLASCFLRVGSFFSSRRFRHGDFKIENILLSYYTGTVPPGFPPAYNRLKVSDYGQSFFMREDEEFVGSERGTPIFRAPETCTASPYIHPRSEVYTVGLALYDFCGIDPKHVSALQEGDKNLLQHPRVQLVHDKAPYLERMVATNPNDRLRFEDLCALDPLRGVPDQTVVDFFCSAASALELLCNQSPYGTNESYLKLYRARLSECERSGLKRDPVTAFNFVDMLRLNRGPDVMQPLWQSRPLSTGAAPPAKSIPPSNVNPSTSYIPAQKYGDLGAQACESWIEELKLPEVIKTAQKQNMRLREETSPLESVEPNTREKIVAALQIVLPEIEKLSRQSAGVINLTEEVRKRIDALRHPSLVRSIISILPLDLYPQ